MLQSQRDWRTQKSNRPKLFPEWINPTEMWVCIPTGADGLPLVPVPVQDCPPGSVSLPSCDQASPGELCEGDGQCGTRRAWCWEDGHVGKGFGDDNNRKRKLLGGSHNVLIVTSLKGNWWGAFIGTDPQDGCQQLLRCKLHLSSLPGCVSEITGIHQKLERNEIEGLNYLEKNVGWGPRSCKFRSGTSKWVGKLCFFCAPTDLVESAKPYGYLGSSRTKIVTLESGTGRRG